MFVYSDNANSIIYVAVRLIVFVAPLIALFEIGAPIAAMFVAIMYVAIVSTFIIDRTVNAS